MNRYAPFWMGLFGVALTLSLRAQEEFPVNGTLEKDQVVYVLENAHIYPQAGDTLLGDLAVFQGKIVGLGDLKNQYPGAVRIDATGQHIYPSFIDLWSDYGMPKDPPKKRVRGPQEASTKKGAYGWNEAIKPELRAAELFSVSHAGDQTAKLRKAGFGAVMSHVQDGIMRGTACLVSMNEEDKKALLMPEVGAVSSFRKGSSQQDYPSSLMGVIALIRQSLYDARWYHENRSSRSTNLSLEALVRIQDAQLPQFFEGSDKLDILRADKIGDEFGIQYIIKDNGDSYQRIKEVAATGAPLIVSLDFPETPDVSDPYLARLLSISELKHWELAAINPAALYLAGVPFVFTADGLKDPSKLHEQVQKAIAYGLPPSEALAALTSRPAELIGAEALIGSLEPGKLANFILADGPLFEAGTKLSEHWVQGKRERFIDRDLADLSGTYALTFEEQTFTLKVSGEAGKHKAQFEIIRGNEEERDTTQHTVKLVQEDQQLSLRFGPLDSLFQGVYLFSGNAFSDSRIWKGSGQDPQGDWLTWAAVRESEHEEKKKEVQAVAAPDSLGHVMFPFTAYGRMQMPEQEFLLIKNATVWTNEADGIIENGQVLIRDGKILAVGQSIDVAEILGKEASDLKTFDAKGMHLTPGIIDEHSHIAISRGVNEGSQASSAEVSIASVVNSEDVNIYRQLSGGVTAAQLLHGSANPIGGQSAIIKLRWGATPDEMHIDQADPFIKFALGENVKQANWGDDYTSRFPQSRMGVEQVYYDLFIRAREYEAEWAAYKEAASKRRRKRDPEPIAPRRDLEMETILQILNKERFISCHSYRQDEINMLMHVADSMGFTVNTFTHILEGYKVADKMREHGAGGSSFSDWWAYKYEVKDAIPYNGAVLWSQGVVTAFNSDDAEMARRLNQEAAKAYKYGGVPEEEALKFVTLNPAILLHLDDRMGSIKVGKDADLVLWNDHPLSIYAKAMVTFVDGRRMFDREEDFVLRDRIRAERARIIQKMLNADSEGKGKKPTEKVPRHYHCETITDEIR